MVQIAANNCEQKICKIQLMKEVHICLAQLMTPEVFPIQYFLFLLF